MLSPLAVDDEVEGGDSGAAPGADSAADPQGPGAMAPVVPCEPVLADLDGRLAEPSCGEHD